MIFFVLGVLLPWRGRLRLQKLLALPEMSSRERLLLYASTIAFQWIAVAITAWRAWARGLTFEEVGLVVHGRGRIFIAAIVGAAILGGLQWLNLRRMGGSSGKAREFIRALAERIFPRSRVELVCFLGLAATAGLCEEFLYRGFSMAALTRAGLPVWSVVLFSSLLFGLAHLYQGRGGLVSTLIIGMVFGTARIAYDGMIPVILWHFAVDAVAGLAGPRYLLSFKRSTVEVEMHQTDVL
ncbi:MAG TPA: type II CAAX endopeptidase family protein [Candidatus Acidoferrum sp.]|nr:type II CAAX endopeptidase family protein [Candidatus Acidoferrum sp.]